MSKRQLKGRQNQTHTQLGQAAVQIFAANERMNQVLIEHLDPAAWGAKPPGKTRTIAAIFTHMHNVRTKWIRLTAPHLKVPPQLNRAHCTPQQARAALAESAAGCRPGLRRSSVITRTPKYTSTTPVTSRWKRIIAKLPTPFGSSSIAS